MLSRIVKPLLFAWLGSFALALVVLLYVTGIRGELFNTTPSAFFLIFTVAFGLGSLSFLLCIFFYALNEQVKNSERPNWLFVLIKAVLAILVFPLYFLIKTGSSYRKNKPKLFDVRHLLFLGTLFVILPFWFLGYLLIFMGSTRVFGLRYYMSPGMGVDTMLPTLPKDSQFRLYPYKNILYKLSPSFVYKLQHGDIISFSNATTKKFFSGNFVERIIALPGDTIELKGGIVFLNGNPLDESYTLTPNSTHAYDTQFKVQDKIYDGNFLPECKALTIPENKLFGLVDNRENGDDSRVFGLVDFNDIESYLPLKDQESGYQGDYSNIIKNNSSWRQPDTTLTQEVLRNASTACR